MASAPLTRSGDGWLPGRPMMPMPLFLLLLLIRRRRSSCLNLKHVRAEANETKCEILLILKASRRETQRRPSVASAKRRKQRRAAAVDNLKENCDRVLPKFGPNPIIF